MGTPLERATRERDLYLRLLGLADAPAVAPFLQAALALLVDAAEARSGYLELHDAHGEPTWDLAVGFDDTAVQAVRRAISRGVIAEAIATGRTVLTTSALDDPRFGTQASVRRNRIEAVLCAPIGGDPPVGVVYLQGRTDPGPWSDADVALVETIATQLRGITARVVAEQEARDRVDPTRPWRERLAADDLVGQSPALARALEQIALLAPLDVDVLLTGPTGSGKSLAARVVHANSRRRAGPLVELNCAALPTELLEAELFGAMPGAYTGAARQMRGKVEAARGGTLFLDEITELSVDAQAKLLQLLQQRTYFRLGGDRPVDADVRVVAATNVDLEVAVAERRFREDLLYRLQILPIRVPSLAERREDIALLAANAVDQATRRHRLGPVRLSASAVDALTRAEWPGNVRQLAHTVEAAMIRARGEGSDVVERRHVFPPPPGATSDGAAETFQAATRQFQADLLRRTLDANDWNVTATARHLDMARSHLYALIKDLAIRR